MSADDPGVEGGVRDDAASDDAYCPPPSRRAQPLVALTGMPNSGKTTLFNALTGSRIQTANYPGSTVEHSEGKLNTGAGELRLLDVPGITSLSPSSQDEMIAVQALSGHSPPGIPEAYIAVVDATQLERHLYLARQLQGIGRPVLVAITMVDILEKGKGYRLDSSALERELGCPVVPVNGVSGLGIERLRQLIGELIADRDRQAGTPAHPNQPIEFPRPTFDEISESYRELKILSAKVLISIGKERAPAGSDQGRPGIDFPDSRTEKFDKIFLHPIFGIVVFAAIMAIIFTSIFTLAQPLMDLVDNLFAGMATILTGALPPSWFTSLLADGIITGVGALSIFLPQIFILFLFLGFLEDSGYLARGAMLVDRFLASVGLSGRAFVPMLSGFACAVPAMMAARTMGSRRERLLTIVILPLMLCSARLPVYGLLLAFLTPPDKPWIGGLSLTALYLFSASAGLVVAALLGRLLGFKKRDRAPLLLELPAIRRPMARVVFRTTLHRTLSYVQKAGPTILVVAVILWVLTHFPSQTGMSEAEQLAGSWAASLGHFLEPVMRPLGLDWRVGVALICAFSAREVFVSALALTLMVAATGDAVQSSLLLAMRNATLPDGSPLFTLASCIGLIVFFIFALQCMATLAVSRQESGGWRVPGLQLILYNAVAYMAAVITVQGLRLIGVS